GFKVEVRPSGVTGVAGVANGLPLRDCLTRADGNLRQVGVARVHAATVVNQDRGSKTTGPPPGRLYYPAILGCPDRCSRVGPVVDTCVEARHPAGDAIVRDWHDKVGAGV